MTDLVSVYTENYKLLFRIVYAYVGDIEDTKDILQDVFIRAYKAARTDIASGELLPWLIVIAKNTSKTFLKKRAPANTANAEDNAYYEPDFLEFAIYDALNEMIAIVPEDYREPLRMHLIDDIPLKKVASRHGIAYSRLRYWKNIFSSSIRPFIK